MKSTIKIFTISILLLSIFLNVQFIIVDELKKNDNTIKFEWEGLEKDIPKEGYVQITKTNENTIYLNPIDE